MCTQLPGIKYSYAKMYVEKTLYINTRTTKKTNITYIGLDISH